MATDHRHVPDDVRVPVAQRKTDAIVNEIKRWIVSSEMQPGDPLPKERDLIELFQASRGSVREALNALQYQGLIQIKQGARGGAVIASASYQRTAAFLRGYFYFNDLTWAQIYDVRRAMEPVLAAEVTPLLTDEAFAALNDSIRICEANMGDDGDLVALRQAEIAFHTVLAKHCPNPLTTFVCQFINDLMTELTVTRNIVDPGGEDFTRDNVRAHRDILAALRQRDSAEVERLMRTHIHEAACFVCAREGVVEPRLLL